LDVKALRDRIDQEVNEKAARLEHISQLELLALSAAIEPVRQNCFSRSSLLWMLMSSAPPRVGELLGLPPGGPDCLDIPDSVEPSGGSDEDKGRKMRSKGANDLV
jgi:hypothetical protein